MKREYKVACTVLLAIGSYTGMLADEPLIKIFPVVRKLTQVGGSVKQEWYILLGRNTGKKYEYDYEQKQFLYKKGLFAELAVAPSAIAGWVVNRNPTIGSITKDDIFQMLSKVTQEAYRNLDVFEKTMAILPKFPVSGGDAYFVLLNYDYPLEYLNTQATGAYKDAYMWIDASALSTMPALEIQKKGIQENTAKIVQDCWLQAYTMFIQKLRS
jgi:hypothetical protein